MQFKHPELLYALFLLVIPIIVHLFQLRKFQKEMFTNVAFLKEVTLQTRKSSQLKKWLTLLTRLLLLVAIIIAFAQPYTSKKNSFIAKTETVIYLDNSFSMQAKGNRGELLNRAIQDLISQVNEDENVSLITNNQTFKNTTIKAIKNELLKLEYSSQQLNYDAVLLKAKKIFSNTADSHKNLIFISDFQQNENLFNPKADSLIKINAVALKPVNANNVSIDSIYISNKTATQIEFTVRLKNSGITIENLPVSLFNDSNLIAKTSVEINEDTTTTFTLDVDEIINGQVVIDDTNLQFDNTLFFNINKSSKINVMSVNNAEDDFLKKIYTIDEFNYTSTELKQLNYNVIESQNLIILNELKSIPNSLTIALKSFTNNGGELVIIPAINTSIETYNNLLSNYRLAINSNNNLEKSITTINYSHPIYQNVFDKKINNFQYPKVNSFYNLTSNTSSLLQFEDGKPFLVQNLNVTVFASALNSDNSNFKNSPLIVPTLFNIGKQSLKTPNIYYTIGEDNTFDIAVKLLQNDVLSMVDDAINIIPQQRYYNNKIAITTNELPEKASIYTIQNNDQVIENVSYNYKRSESNLVYQDLNSIPHIEVNNSITELFNKLKSDAKVNELWKWFIIFALLFLIIEMLILKYFK